MSLRHAWAFLTRLPGGAHPDDELNLGRSVPWFPVVGVVIGVLIGTCYWALYGPLGPMLAAVATVAVGVVLTGAFHEDGLADTADGLGAMTARRRLEIMKDSRVGTFGSLALVLSTLARVVALAALGPADGVVALVLANGVGRSMATLVMVAATPAAATGLGHSYTANVPRGPVVGVGLATAAVALALGPASSVGLVAAAVGAAGVAALARRAFGGITGDVLGAVEQVGELAVLVAAARLVADNGWTWG